MLAAANRRKSERRLCRSLAKIQFGTGGLPRDCVITDISAGGVKIVAEHLEPPSEFTLIFDTGLHEYLDRLQAKLNAIGGALFNAYIFQQFNNLDDEIMVQQEEQQQQ